MISTFREVIIRKPILVIYLDLILIVLFSCFEKLNWSVD